MHRNCRRVQGARASLLWGLVFFAGAQLALNVVLEVWRPEVYDPEFGARLATLRARLAENPGRPLLLLVGSSRVESDFLPEVLPPLRAVHGGGPLPFNFTHLAADPPMNLLIVRRLLGQGIRPDWLVVELMPAKLAGWTQDVLAATTTARDLPVARRYLGAVKAYRRFLGARLVPCYSRRLPVLHACVPSWVLPADWRQQQVPLGRLGGDYCWKAEVAPKPEDVRARTDNTLACYYGHVHDLQIEGAADRATHELLDLCGCEGIRVALLLAPEAATFQACYSPAARRRLDDYCSGLARQYGVPLIDARGWMADQDFVDSHHLLLSGAWTFTLRLGREGLQPLVEGRLPAGP